MRTLLEAQSRLRRVAEEQAREARRELERLAEAVCPEEVDRIRRRSPEGLSSLSPHQVARMILAALPPSGWAAVLPQRQEPARRSVELEDRIRQLQERLRAAEERAERAEAEVALLRQRLQATGVPSPAEAGPARRELVQSAADLLAAAGYEVDPSPGPLLLPDGGAFRPDLMLWLGERSLPVEVEELSRPSSEREGRWQACYTLGGGHLLFVAPDPGALDVLRSEVFFWIGPRPFRLWMTDLERGRGRRGEAIWLVRRESAGAWGGGE